MIELYRDIWKNYQEGNYEKVIKLIEQYMQIPKIGLDSELIYCYAFCLMRIGYEEKARKIYNVFQDVFDEAISNVELASTDIKNKKYIEAKNRLEQVLEKYPYYDVVLYYLCTIEAKLGNYEKSGIYLDDLIKVSKNPILIEDAKKLLNYYEFNNISDMNYKLFEEQNIPLKPGYIVRVKKGTLAYLNVPFEKPFLIYKIKGNNIYGFPINFKIKPQYYIFRALGDQECQLYPELVSFKKQGIINVDDKITDEQYQLCLEDLYKRYEKYWQSKDVENNMFMTDMKQKVLKRGI